MSFLLKIPFTRKGALKRLAERATEKELPALLYLLDVKTFRKLDSESLSNLKSAFQSVGTAATNPLRTCLLEDGSGFVKDFAAETLAGIEPEGHDAILQCFHNGDPRTRESILYAAKSLPDERRRHLAILGLSDAQKQISDLGHGIIKRDAGFADTSSLVSALQSEHHHSRAHAIDLLIEKNGEVAAEFVVPLLSDSNSAIQKKAIRFCEKFPMPNALRQLEVLAKTGDYSTKISAVSALGKIGSPDSVRVLKQFVESDADNAVRQNAIKSIAESKDPAMIPWLSMIVENGDAKLHTTVLEALSRIGEPAVDTLIRFMTRGHPGAIPALGATRTNKATEHLISNLKNELMQDFPSDRNLIRGSTVGVSKGSWASNVVTAIGQSRSLLAVKPLIELFPLARFDFVQWAFVKALGTCEIKGVTPEAFPFLKSVAMDKSQFGKEVRAQAVRALGEIGDPQAVAVFNNILSSGEEPQQVVTAALWAKERMQNIRVKDYDGWAFSG